MRRERERERGESHLIRDDYSTYAVYHNYIFLCAPALSNCKFQEKRACKVTNKDTYITTQI